MLQITISKDDTVILDGAGDKKSIEERCEQVCVDLEIWFSQGACIIFISNHLSALMILLTCF